MDWQRGRRSQNIEDRRGGRGKKAVGLSGGAILVIAAVALLLGQNPLEVLQAVSGAQSSVNQGRRTAPSTTRPPSPAEDKAADFVSVVLADTEDVWNGIFRKAGAKYQEPKLVLYRGSTPTACGLGKAATGPFYCPGDSKMYLDLEFLGTLKRMGASGDFAVAYVIAHEVGHHIQNLTGVARKVHESKKRVSKTAANQIQVKMELQADCYAGVWAHHAHRQRKVLQKGDIEEGLRAAAAVGDDTLQRNAGRRVTPEAFTHGSSKQRMTWFTKGLETGSIKACNTFGG